MALTSLFFVVTNGSDKWTCSKGPMNKEEQKDVCITLVLYINILVTYSLLSSFNNICRHLHKQPNSEPSDSFLILCVCMWLPYVDYSIWSYIQCSHIGKPWPSTALQSMYWQQSTHGRSFMHNNLHMEVMQILIKKWLPYRNLIMCETEIIHKNLFREQT